MVIARSVLSDPHPHIMSFSFLSLVLPQRLRSGSRGLRQRVRRICTLRPSPHRSLGQRRVHLRVAHLDRVALVLDGALRRRLGHALRDHESGPLCLPRLCLDHGTGTGHAHVRPGVRCGRLRPGASASPLSLNLPSSWSDLSHKLQVALALALGYFVTLLLWKWDYDPDGTPLPIPLPLVRPLTKPRFPASQSTPFHSSPPFSTSPVNSCSSRPSRPLAMSRGRHRNWACWLLRC